MLKKCGIKPNLVIGDFDSLDIREVPKDIESKKLSTQKDETDTMAALQEAIKLGYKDICIVGGISDDIAHVYANITLLKYAYSNNAKAYIKSPLCDIYYMKDNVIKLEYKKNARTSIFSYSEISKGVTLEGFEYELKDATLSNENPIGVSNVVKEELQIVKVENGELIIIIDNNY